MLTHTQKLKLARKPGMRTRLERKTSLLIQIPTLPHGTMISRHFTTKQWIDRRDHRGPVTKEVLDKPLVKE